MLVGLVLAAVGNGRSGQRESRLVGHQREQIDGLFQKDGEGLIAKYCHGTENGEGNTAKYCHGMGNLARLSFPRSRILLHQLATSPSRPPNQECPPGLRVPLV